MFVYKLSHFPFLCDMRSSDESWQTCTTFSSATKLTEQCMVQCGKKTGYFLNRPS